MPRQVVKNTSMYKSMEFRLVSFHRSFLLVLVKKMEAHNFIMGVVDRWYGVRDNTWVMTIQCVRFSKFFTSKDT